jgi:hypothetical protein
VLALDILLHHDTGQNSFLLNVLRHDDVGFMEVVCVGDAEANDGIETDEADEVEAVLQLDTAVHQVISCRALTQIAQSAGSYTRPSESPG